MAIGYVVSYHPNLLVQNFDLLVGVQKGLLHGHVFVLVELEESQQLFHRLICGVEAIQAAVLLKLLVYTPHARFQLDFEKGALFYSRFGSFPDLFGHIFQHFLLLQYDRFDTRDLKRLTSVSKGFFKDNLFLNNLNKG